MLSIKFSPISARRPGLSLIEIMIAMVMTLIVLGAMMAAFAYGSSEMQKGRATIELNNRLIIAEEQLRRDLDRITVEFKPHQQLSILPKGYAEIVDGPQTDYIAANDSATGPNSLVFGDRDDFFACTIKTDGKAFRGRLGDSIIESPLAEVAWFTVFDASTPDTTDVLLVRRQLLILPTPPTGPLFSSSNPVLADREAEVNDFISRTDVSVRVIRTGATHSVFANSLADLALRGNRFAHTGALGSADRNETPTTSLLEVLQLGSRFNENHVMASSVAAFDVQVFAPDAANFVVSSVDSTGAPIIGDLAEPGDIGYQNATSPLTFDLVSGAFVDLGKVNLVAAVGAPVTQPGARPVLGSSSNRYFFGYNPETGFLGTASNGFVSLFHPGVGVVPFDSTNVAGMGIYETYDTGTSQYNRNTPNDRGSNGIDDDVDGLIDESDIDENNNGVIDIGTTEVGELDAPPAYDVPIRGVKFTMRVIEPNTNQVRQLSVSKSYVAQ